MKTAIYILGLLSLSYTDFHHPSAFYSQLLPLADLAFLLFIALDISSYITVLGFESSQYGLYHLASDLFNLNEDIRELGPLTALTDFFFSALDLVLLLTALVYALTTLLELTMW